MVTSETLKAHTALLRVRVLAALMALVFIVWWSIHLLLLSFRIQTAPPDPIYTLAFIGLMSIFLGLTLVGPSDRDVQG
ncbi:MAG: hypothetical protein ACE5IJ_01005 [Thermoplasmata archaeon]